MESKSVITFCLTGPNCEICAAGYRKDALDESLYACKYQTTLVTIARPSTRLPFYTSGKLSCAPPLLGTVLPQPK